MAKKNAPNTTSYDHTAKRLYIDSPLSPALSYACDSQQVNYLLNVLRMKNDETLYVFNGKDGEWLAAVEIVKKNACNLIIRTKAKEQTQAQEIDYLFAPVKRSRLDYMVQKATELGVSSITPVITNRTIVDRVNQDRMKSNVIEAAEQCGILNIPEVGDPVKFSKLLENWPDDKLLIHCDEMAEMASPVEQLKLLKPGPVAVLIGPEGGFDAQERDALHRMDNAASLSLGPRIMRADTAAVAILTLVNAILGDWK